MKTWSKIPIVGVPVPLVGRNFGRSSANGCGISGWNSASSSLPQPCASLNLPRRTFPNQHLEPRLPPKLRRLSQWCMALRNGHVPRLPAAFQDRRLRLNLMGRSCVLPIILFMHKNADRSAMALTVCCMQLASGIVPPAPGGLRVKKAVTPRNHVGSVPFSGQPPPLQRVPQHLFPRWLKLPQRRLNSSRASQCFGRIGHVVNSDGGGSL